MDRSNFPSKVEVRRADLIRTEDSKAFHILQRFIDIGQPGVVQGLTVQQSSTGNDRFDLISGFGYVPKGELVELINTLEAQAITAASGLPQLVGLMYRERLTNAGAAETDGVARNREVIRDAELRIFGATEFDALPVTFDEDLSIDVQDRFLICAVVERGATETAPLVITLPPTFDLIKTLPQPSNITGVVVTNIDPTTQNSDPFPASGAPDLARLIYEPSTNLLAYKAPQDNVDLAQAAPFNVIGLGVPVDISGGGTFTLTSANGLNTATVVVDVVLLPTITSSSVSDSLSVAPVYFPTAQRASGRDDLHRHKLGGQIPSNTNVHGVRFSDIATLVEELIGSLSLGTQYLDTLAKAEIPRLLFPPNTLVDAGSGDIRFQHMVQIGGAGTFGPNGASTNIRVYRSGFDSLIILLNAKVRNVGTSATFERLLANGDNPDIQSAMIELDPAAVVFYSHDPGSADIWNFTEFDRVQLFHSFSSDTTTLSGGLRVNGGLIVDTRDSATATASNGPAANQVQLSAGTFENVAVGDVFTLASGPTFEDVIIATPNTTTITLRKDVATFTNESWNVKRHPAARGAADMKVEAARDFSYHQPRTYVKWINGHELYASLPSGWRAGGLSGILSDNVRAFSVSPTTPSVLAALHLPDGAIVQTVEVSADVIGNASFEGGVGRVRIDQASSDSLIAAGQVALPSTLDTPATNALFDLGVDQFLEIDNTNFQYYVGFETTVATDNWFLFGVKITYTLVGLRPE